MSPKNLVAVFGAALIVCSGTAEAQLTSGLRAGRTPYGGWRAVQIARRVHRRTSDHVPPRPETVRVAVRSAPPDERASAAQLEQKQSPFLGPWSQSYGQVWREYDIVPYTAGVTSTSRPEQAIVDWVLRETGEDSWHGDKVAVLSADRSKLRVYHSPEVQSRVEEIVNRFVQGGPEQIAVRFRLVTVGDPAWRRSVHGMLRPIPGSTRGPQAWLLQREDASLLRNELAKRRDHQVRGAPHALVHNGQSRTIHMTGQRRYVRDILLTPETFPGYQEQIDELDEGLVLELLPLLTSDEQFVDAYLKMQLDQVEALREVIIDVPTSTGRSRLPRIQVPQVAQRRMEERFRWPTSHVLLVSLGMAPPPVPTNTRVVPFVAPRREELLLFVDVRAGDAVQVGPVARRRIASEVQAASSPVASPVVHAAAGATRGDPTEVAARTNSARTASRIRTHSDSYRYRPPATALRPRYRR